MLSAVLFTVLAQVHTTTPPSQPSLPNPEERAMQQLRIGNSIASGDGHYMHRSDGRHGDVADPREIDAALDDYAAVMKKSRNDADAKWKYLRATYFKAEYTGLTDAQKAALYERAQPVADDAVAAQRARAAEKSGGRPAALEPPDIGKALVGDATAGETFFWTAVTWGQWSLVHGKMAAVRQGVAAKVRDDARAAIAIDPTLEDAGGYRVLGRLHAVSPKVLFFTGWIDRDEALKDLREAVRIAPDNLVNRLFLAEAIHEYSEDRAPAIDLLKGVLAATPHPDHLVEDLKIQADAQRDLQAWGAS
jgi:tetratricopeptide (TPR) repeat protein